MTAIFVVALGYDAWYYLFAHAGVTEYTINTQIQKMGKNSLLKILVIFVAFDSRFHSMYSVQGLKVPVLHMPDNNLFRSR